MTAQEALMIIQAIPEKIWNQLSDTENEAMEVLYECAEKQIPKKPVYHDDCGNKTPYQPRCPKCYEAINETWHLAGESWCPDCGQKLEWN